MTEPKRLSRLSIGDQIFSNIKGKVIGALCAISGNGSKVFILKWNLSYKNKNFIILGIILLAMPVGLLSSNFNEVYKLEELKKKIIERYEKNKAKKEKLTVVSLDSEKQIQDHDKDKWRQMKKFSVSIFLYYF